jgi:hypothetical protein
MKDQRATEKLDALLREVGSSPAASGRTDAAWDDWADATLKRALEKKSAGAGDAELVASVLKAPALEPEVGEPSSVVGDSKMSSDRDPPSKAGSSGPSSMRPRPSLKELAERVSKTPPPPSVAPGRASVPEIPAATMKAPSSPPASTATPLPAPPPASIRVVDAPAPASAPPPSVPASAPPIAPAAKASEPTSKAPATLPTGVTPAAAKPAEKSGGAGGIVIALFVVAAAAAGGFFYLRSQKSEPATAKQDAPVVTATAKTEATAAPTATAEAKAEAPKASDGALDINQLGDATAQPSGVALGGPLPPAASGAASAVATNDEKKGPVKVNPDGTLDDAMKKEVGPDDPKAKEASPASDGAGPKNLPDAPPQGSVTAAIGAVKGAAKACVSGADDVSTAMVTFGSSGSVQSVSVSGWAAGKPAASCIQSALKGANVGPFSKPTFAVPVTIRP